VLQEIANRLSAGWAYETVADVTADLARALPPYAEAINKADRVMWSDRS
jgi:predicted molibdopterin-dependent oxidoreductase YjgC